MTILIFAFEPPVQHFLRFRKMPLHDLDLPAQKVRQVPAVAPRGLLRKENHADVSALFDELEERLGILDLAGHHRLEPGEVGVDLPRQFRLDALPGVLVEDPLALEEVCSRGVHMAKEPELPLVGRQVRLRAGCLRVLTQVGLEPGGGTPEGLARPRSAIAIEGVPLRQREPAFAAEQMSVAEPQVAGEGVSQPPLAFLRREGRGVRHERAHQRAAGGVFGA